MTEVTKQDEFQQIHTEGGFQAFLPNFDHICQSADTYDLAIW